MVEYMTGGPDNVETVLDDIEASWSKLTVGRAQVRPSGTRGAVARRPFWPALGAGRLKGRQG